MEVEFVFVSFPQKLNESILDFMPIKIEFVIENVNIFYVDKQTGEHTIFIYRKKYMSRTQKEMKMYHK